MNAALWTIPFFIIGAVYGTDAPEWNGLRVTWSLNPFNRWGFNGLPRVVSEQTPEFKLRDDQCQSGNTKFLGQRYWYNGDPAVTLLYDTNGTIAGIQTSAPKTTFKPPSQLMNRQFIDDGDYWTATAYFVDPSTICGNGRTHEQLTADGTGTGLWLQMGPNPVKDSVNIPSSEEEVKAATKWSLGRCFLTMGNHYWYNVTKDMDCDDFLPYCLLYNKGKLTAFCFSINAQLTSPRYEHPPAGAATMFIKPVPDCFSTVESFKKPSTMHVYFADNARSSSWC